MKTRLWSLHKQTNKQTNGPQANKQTKHKLIFQRRSAPRWRRDRECERPSPPRPIPLRGQGHPQAVPPALGHRHRHRQVGQRRGRIRGRRRGHRAASAEPPGLARRARPHQPELQAASAADGGPRTGTASDHCDSDRVWAKADAADEAREAAKADSAPDDRVREGPGEEESGVQHRRRKGLSEGDHGHIRQDHSADRTGRGGGKTQ